MEENRVKQVDTATTAYRLNIVVDSGGNLDLDFLKGSILSQPLALDRHHLVCPARLRGQILDVSLSEISFT